jgi:hypothetical protein
LDILPADYRRYFAVRRLVRQAASATYGRRNSPMATSMFVSSCS